MGASAPSSFREKKMIDIQAIREKLGAGENQGDINLNGMELLSTILALCNEVERLQETATGCGLAISHGMGCPIINPPEDGDD
jgi:hypothetical protein